MNKEQLKQRTKDFALRVMTLVDHLPKNRKGRILGDQLLRSATSVAANYRAACRARSSAEFAAKLGTVLEEERECPLDGINCRWRTAQAIIGRSFVGGSK